MRVRWLAAISAMAILISYEERNLVTAYIAIFGFLIAYALRRIEGAINHFRLPADQIELEVRTLVSRVTIENQQRCSKSIHMSPMSPIFAGDIPTSLNPKPID